MNDWRETEINARPATLFANRVATYTSADGIVTIRFLHVKGLKRSKLNDGLDTLELVNIAEVALPGPVAKQVLVDVAKSIAQIEERMGPIESMDELHARWVAEKPQPRQKPARRKR